MKVTIAAIMAAEVNWKIVISIGSFPLDKTLTATMWAANRKPLSRASPSPSNLAAMP